MLHHMAARNEAELLLVVKKYVPDAFDEKVRLHSYDQSSPISDFFKSIFALNPEDTFLYLNRLC